MLGIKVAKWHPTVILQHVGSGVDLWIYPFLWEIFWSIPLDLQMERWSSCRVLHRGRGILCLAERQLCVCNFRNHIDIMWKSTFSCFLCSFIGWIFFYQKNKICPIRIIPIFSTCLSNLHLQRISQSIDLLEKVVPVANKIWHTKRATPQIITMTFGQDSESIFKLHGVSNSCANPLRFDHGKYPKLIRWNAVKNVMMCVGEAHVNCQRFKGLSEFSNWKNFDLI